MPELVAPPATMPLQPPARDPFAQPRPTPMLQATTWRLEGAEGLSAVGACYAAGRFRATMLATSNPAMTRQPVEKARMIP